MAFTEYRPLARRYSVNFTIWPTLVRPDFACLPGWQSGTEGMGREPRW